MDGTTPRREQMRLVVRVDDTLAAAFKERASAGGRSVQEALEGYVRSVAGGGPLELADAGSAGEPGRGLPTRGSFAVLGHRQGSELSLWLAWTLAEAGIRTLVATSDEHGLPGEAESVRGGRFTVTPQDLLDGRFPAVPVHGFDVLHLGDVSGIDGFSPKQARALDALLRREWDAVVYDLGMGPGQTPAAVLKGVLPLVGAVALSADQAFTTIVHLHHQMDAGAYASARGRSVVALGSYRPAAAGFSAGDVASHLGLPVVPLPAAPLSDCLRPTASELAPEDPWQGGLRAGLATLWEALVLASGRG